MINRCEIGGVVMKTPKQKMTPNGISHCQFFLSHQSEQIEAGLNRASQCVIPVIFSSQEQISHNINKGSKISVSGFLNQHKMRSGIQQLILHAEQITLID